MPFFTSQQHSHVEQVVKRLGNALMKKGSHGYDQHKGKTIFEASQANQIGFVVNAELHPAIALMDVILASNRDYNKQVIRHVRRMREQYPDLTFKKLGRMLQTKYPDAKSFKAVWGHNDARKYAVLTELVRRINAMNPKAKSKDCDFRFMSEWREDAILAQRHRDQLTRAIPFFAFASFQHLRMTFGADTVKPDKRVKQVLQREFGHLYQFGRNISDQKTVMMVEEIAGILDCDVLTIDQIFVKYGSGHYAMNDQPSRKRAATYCPKVCRTVTGQARAR